MIQSDLLHSRKGDQKRTRCDTIPTLIVSLPFGKRLRCLLSLYY